MISVIHIAEKPSIAQAIAKGLSSIQGSSQCNFGGGGRSLPTHDIPHLHFPKAPNAERCSHKVTSVAGHVFGTDFGSEYQSWDSVDPAELFHAPIVKKAQKGSVVKHLQTEARGCDFVVLWLDCDREGENIAFEVLDCIMHLMKSGGDSGVANYDRVYRAYFSAINPSDISKAYGLLGKPDKCQSLSVDARQELDLKVGVAFSRFQTRYFQGRYGDLDSAVLSYGPCQTPTLGFCVQRHIEIETFKPTPYWVLDLGVLKRGRMCRAQWASGRSFNQNKTNALVQLCKDTPGASAEVLSVVTKEKKQGRPTPLNTVQILKAASKALGMGPHAAMQCAERLYLVSKRLQTLFRACRRMPTDSSPLFPSPSFYFHFSERIPQLLTQPLSMSRDAFMSSQEITSGGATSEIYLPLESTRHEVVSTWGIIRPSRPAAPTLENLVAIWLVCTNSVLGILLPVCRTMPFGRVELKIDILEEQGKDRVASPLLARN